MKKFSAIVLTLLLLCCAACTKKTSNSNATERGASSGTMTESKSSNASAPGSASNSGAESNAPGAPRELSGTWIVAQPGETWELVITRTGPGTYAGSSTLLTTDNPKGLNGP